MDTTYFGRDFGVMVLMDSINQQVLSVDEVKYETNALYAAALTTLKEKGVEIQSIVCDGRKGLLQMFPERWCPKMYAGKRRANKKQRKHDIFELCTLKLLFAVPVAVGRI